ncbi:uncharacterized protein Bfra_002090 [Botrytis fragariae]|uniref:Uncharacterized protein n=1 Tax=Botrytis fragariae TaxID=1964551 RepID=A0A8H6B276_9HELO|nr:uncharacterized protein Bfra_002090 [Botrytis fragariae]KAF5877722.1 hypothetical protein Bfra_002090 [Botrytis fragariae]
MFTSLLLSLQEFSIGDLVRHLSNEVVDLYVREEVALIGTMLSFFEITKVAFDSLKPNRLDDID